MNDPHERFRELAALALYDELDAAELAALASHLASCAPCRALGEELALGLGRLSPAPAGDDLPPAWLAALRARIERVESPLEPRATRASAWPSFAWKTFAAGLAAGLAASLLWIRIAPERSEPALTTTERAPLASEPELVASTAFARATPPPRTSSPGPFAPLATLRRER